MADDKNFDQNIAKFIAASAYSLVTMTVAREMFGKGYFELGVGERALADQTVLQMVGANIQAITPQLFAGPIAQTQVGFQPPKPQATQPPTATETQPTTDQKKS